MEVVWCRFYSSAWKVMHTNTCKVMLSYSYFWRDRASVQAANGLILLPHSKLKFCRLQATRVHFYSQETNRLAKSSIGRSTASKIRSLRCYLFRSIPVSLPQNWGCILQLQRNNSGRFKIFLWGYISCAIDLRFFQFTEIVWARGIKYGEERRSRDYALFVHGIRHTSLDDYPSCRKIPFLRIVSRACLPASLVHVW